MRAVARPEGRGWPIVLVAFVVITGALAVTNGTMFFEIVHVQGRADAILQRELANTELVERIGENTYRERMLTDAHVLEKKAGVMARIEREIAQTEADSAAATTEFDALRKSPQVADAWRQLKEDAASIGQPLEGVIALSRENRDPEARAALRAIEDRFALVDRDVVRLLQVDRMEARNAVVRVQRLQRSFALLFGVLASVTEFVTIVVAGWTIRLLRRREAQVERFASELEVRNRELDAFAGRVAHDLRGPLTTVTLAATALAQKSPAEATTMTILNRGMARMESLIDDLLSLARIDAQVGQGVCDPAAVAAQVREDLAPRLEAERVAMRLDVEPSSVRCTDGLFRQALANLADNAVKYRRSDVQGEVEIVGRVAGREYHVQVTDNGTGMTEEDTRKAFEPFFRSARVRDRPGTGLGLSIVARVIEASGGSVTLRSRLGQGTTFEIRLPLATA